MKTREQVEEYIARHGKGLLEADYYEACIPKDFWPMDGGDVKVNKKVFDEIILPYCERIQVAMHYGYGLYLTGDNGVGKSLFVCYVLKQAIRRKFSAYYTTALELDYQLKRGMDDRSRMNRLEEMLDSNILAIDELQKEQHKEGDSWIKAQIERILKNRHDNSKPTLVVSNAVLKTEYSHAICSILSGKYERVMMESTDYRVELRSKMRERMS